MGIIKERCKTMAKRSISNLAVRICRAMHQFPRSIPSSGGLFTPVTKWNDVMNITAPEGTLSFRQLVDIAASTHSMNYPTDMEAPARNSYLNLGYKFDQTEEHLRYDLPVIGSTYTGDFYDLCRALALTDVDARIVRIRSSHSYTYPDVFDKVSETLFNIHKLLRDIPRIEVEA